MKITKETKQQRFERIAERRVTEALRQLQLVGNLSNRANYEYSNEHVKQMLDALENEFKQLRQRFREEVTTPGRSFSFAK